MESTANNSRRDAHAARVVLRMIDNRDKVFAETTRDRVVQMMADLDIVLMRLPEDATEHMCLEIERIVTTLRTADENLQNGNNTGSLQILDLARARIDRFARELENYEPPAAS